MQYDFNLAVNGGMKLDVAGRFFKYKNGTGPIRVRASGGGYVDLLPGQGVWNVEFDSLQVQNLHTLANSGVIVAGAFDFRDDRITGTVDVGGTVNISGTVSTVNDAKNRTLAGQSFAASTQTYLPTTGTFARALFINKPTSTKRVVVTSIAVNAGTNMNGGVYLFRSTVNTLAGGAGYKNDTVGGQNRNLAVVNSPNVGIETDNAGSTGVPPQPYMYRFMGPQHATERWTPTEPIILPVNQGLMLSAWGSNTMFEAAFEWFEE